MLRRAFYLALGALTFAATGCDAPLPTVPATTDGRVAIPDTTSAALTTPSYNLGGILKNLLCTVGNGASIAVNQNGGEISVAGVTLDFPRNAVHHLTLILAIPIPGDRPVVQFFPEGLQFDAAPTLTMNTQCIGDPGTAHIVYTDDQGHVLQDLGGTLGTHSVSAQIHHFSRYAVAW